MGVLMGVGRWLQRTIAVCAIVVMPSSFAIAGDSVVISDSPNTVPDFALQNHRGERFDEEHLLGVWSLVFIGFTSCPDVCPVTLMKLEAVRAELGLRFPPERIPQIVFLAVDPHRDKPVLAEYLAHFHPKNIGVTGAHEQLQILTKALGGFYRLEQPKPGSDYYNVIHTATIAVINPEGRVVAKINPPLAVHPIAEQLTYLIRRGREHE